MLYEVITEAIRYALQLDPQNIQAWVEKGNAAYYTPSWFGGSKETAVKAYSTAIQLMEFHNQTQHNWLYMNALTMLAQAQQRTNRIQEANATYRKILSLEPNYVWVRDDRITSYNVCYTKLLRFFGQLVLRYFILNCGYSSSRTHT